DTNAVGTPPPPAELPVGAARGGARAARRERRLGGAAPPRRNGAARAVRDAVAARVATLPGRRARGPDREPGARRPRLRLREPVPDVDEPLHGRGHQASAHLALGGPGGPRGRLCLA